MARSTVSRSCGSTLATPLITRDTVARDTPATRATCSRVGGRGRSRWSVLMRGFIAPTPSGPGGEVHDGPPVARRSGLHHPAVPVATGLPQVVPSADTYTW